MKTTFVFPDGSKKTVELSYTNCSVNTDPKLQQEYDNLPNIAAVDGDVWLVTRVDVVTGDEDNEIVYLKEMMEPSKPNHPVWEYFTDNRRDNEGRIEFLSRLGQEGWELCAIDPNDNYFFKRQVL